MPKSYWLVKQEPEAYSWETFVHEGGTAWTGVRNFQARNHLRSMKKGDAVFFYHSVSEKRIAGIARVAREAYPDPTAAEDGWSAVDLVPLKAMKAPVTLDQIKADAAFKDLPLIRQSRLSVLPVSEKEAARLFELGKTRV